MKKLFLRSLIALSIVCFLSLSFSMQDKTTLRPGDYELIPKTQKPTVLSRQDSLQTYYSNPDLLKGLSDHETAQIQLGDYTSTIKGRSILAVDVDNDSRQEIVVDFGAIGLWLYDPYHTPKWQQLSTKDPAYMIAADRNGDGAFEIYASWGSGNGSEFWEYGTGWTMFDNTSWSDYFYCSADINDDGKEEIVIQLVDVSTGTDYRLYIAQWGSTDFIWRPIHYGLTYGTHAVAFNVPDNELVTSFLDSPRLRWWNWLSGDSDWTDNWTSMADVDVDMTDCTAAYVDADTEEEIIVDIYSPAASSGTWIYNYLSSPKWTRLNANSIFDIRPWRMYTTDTFEIMVCQINYVAGLWLYANPYSPHWRMINGLGPEGDGGFVEVFNYDSDGDNDLAVDFGSTGLWKYDYFGTPKWTGMNGSDPLYMVKVNIDNDTDDELIVVFETSPAGIWIWDNSTTPKWKCINGANPDY